MARRLGFTPEDVDAWVERYEVGGESLYGIARTPLLHRPDGGLQRTTAQAVRYHLKRRGVRFRPEPPLLRAKRT